MIFGPISDAVNEKLATDMPDDFIIASKRPPGRCSPLWSGCANTLWGPGMGLSLGPLEFKTTSLKVFRSVASVRKSVRDVLNILWDGFEGSFLDC